MEIKSIKATDVMPVDGSMGDTWNLAWSREGDLYSPVNDGLGFCAEQKMNHLLFVKMQPDNDSSPRMVGENVNAMDDYDIPLPENATEEEERQWWRVRIADDACTWKTGGCKMIDGTLYLVVGRHRYGEISGDKFRRQSARNASIIKSTDGGKTWTRSEKENYDNPMFPGRRFATPYFLDYGQDGSEAVAHGSDKYVYAHANGGFWDNSSDMVLGRVLRSKIGNLDPADWQYFTGGDGMNDAAWSQNMADAKPVLQTDNMLGSTGAVYLPQWKSYCLIGWGYPDGGGKLPGMHEHTVWNFHVAPTPWGPWRTVGSRTFKPEGFYCPTICPRFISSDGKTAWVATSGNWWDLTWYRLHMVKLEIS